MKTAGNTVSETDPVRQPRSRIAVAGVAVFVVAVVAAGVTVMVAPAQAQGYVTDHAIVTDNFNRSTTDGWGTAQLGGKYSYTSSKFFSSNGSAGISAPPRPVG